MRLVTLLVSVTGLAFAGTWSGYLVDSRCYTSAQNNVSWDSINSRDENMPLRQCAASSRPPSRVRPRRTADARGH